jgi:Rrf2 family protein
MRVSARADYALRAAIELAAASGSHVTGEQLARAQDIPGKFIETILTQLRRTGLVRSQRGADGGFWLARPASEISLADIIRAVDGQFPSARGEPPQNVTYPGPAEPLRRVWIALRAFGPTVLETLTLADIVSGELWLPGGPRLVPRPTGSSFLRGLVCCSARSDVGVVDRVLVPPVAVRAKRVEEDPAERVVVEGVVVVGFWRETRRAGSAAPGAGGSFLSRRG